MKAKKLLSWILALAMVIGMVPAVAMAAEVPSFTGSGTVDDPYQIGSKEDLAALRDSVNAGEPYTGVYFVQTADIDLSGLNWVPIGLATTAHGFCGNYDGRTYKIQNLTITNPAADEDGYVYAGLFGVTEGTSSTRNTIKNLTIENVSISTTGHIVAAAIAYPYYTTVDNINVCGNINISGGDYTAGVLGYTRRCYDASNLTISGSSGSAITGGYTVGGVIADIQSNGGQVTYSNFNASGLTVTGTMHVGGISGIISDQSLAGCSVSNVALNCADSRVGMVSGSLGDVSTITNVAVTNVTGTSAIIGGAYSAGAPVQAKVGDTYYPTLDEALGAATNGQTVTLLANVTIADPIYVTMDLTIDGGSNTLIYTGASRAISVESSASGVDLTVKNLIVNCAAAYCERGINYNTNGTLTLNNVEVMGTNVTYAVSLPGSSDGATVDIDDCVLTANIALNVWGTGMTITVDNSDLTAVDNSDAEGYGAIQLNNNGTEVADDTTVTVTGGSITAEDDSMAVCNWSTTGVVNISGTTAVSGDPAGDVIIRDQNGAGYLSLAGAAAGASAGDTLTLLGNIELTENVTIPDGVALVQNGKTITLTAHCTLTSPVALTVGVADGFALDDSVVDGVYVYTALPAYTVTINGASATYAYGDTISQPVDPTRSGYVFDGWYCNGAPVQFPVTVTGAMNIYAVWTEIYIPPVVTPSVPVDPDPVDPVVPEAPSVDVDAPVVDTTVTENADGSTTKTETLENGAVVETTTGTDGSKTETASKTETVESESGTTTTTTSNTTTTDTEGNTSTETKVEEKVETATGTTATTTTTTETAEKKETVEEKVETVVDEDGNETTTVTTKTETELSDGTKATTNVSAEGTVTAEVEIPAEVAQAGETVTLPVASVTNTKDGEAAATITVTTNNTDNTKVEIPVEGATAGTVVVVVDEDGNETVLKDSVVTENGVVANLPDGATVKVVDNSKEFEDVKDDQWHSDAVDFVSSRDLFQGVSDTKFDAGSEMTIGMMVTVLARLDGQDTTADDGEHWQQPGVDWAVANGIHDGESADENITREEIAVMLWKYAGSPESDHSLDEYHDSDDASSLEALAALKWAVENGVMKGMGNGKLNPNGEATRAQVAQFLKNFIENVK